MRLLGNLAKFLQAAALLLLSAWAAADVIVFEGVNVLPMDERRVLNNHRVIVKDGLIAAIEPSSTAYKGAYDKLIDGEGKFLLPGFSDTHYHQSGEQQRDFELQYKLLLANGITSVYSMGEWGAQNTSAIRDQAGEDNPLSPYYYTAGPILEEYHLRTREDVIKVVQQHKERAYDFIKIHSNLPLDIYLALVAEAEKAGIPLVGHAQRTMPLEFSLRMALIAHMEELVMVHSDEENFKIATFDDALLEKIARQVKDSGIYVAPTLSIVEKIPDYTDSARLEKLKARYESSLLAVDQFINFTTPGQSYLRELLAAPKLRKAVDDLIKANRKLTVALHNAGVPMLVGSDCFGLHVAGFAFHEEMEAMNKAGIPAYDILLAATVSSARFIGRSGSAGTINIGKKAELVLLDKNPLEDIKNSRTVAGVMLKGKWHDRQALDGMLKEVEAAREVERNKLKADSQG